jgi:hypothetical protein
LQDVGRCADCQFDVLGTDTQMRDSANLTAHFSHPTVSPQRFIEEFRVLPPCVDDFEEHDVRLGSRRSHSDARNPGKAFG